MTHLLTRSLALMLLLAACTTVEQPTPAELGQRVRVRVDGREIDSILTRDCFVFFAVLCPDGTRVPMRIRAPASSGCEGLSLIVANEITMRCSCGDLDLVPAQHGPKDQVADLVLPDGYALDFTPGSYLVYAIAADRTATADTGPELRLGQIAADGTRYVELSPASGPKLALHGRPPRFEAAR